MNPEFVGDGKAVPSSRVRLDSTKFSYFDSSFRDIGRIFYGNIKSALIVLLTEFLVSVISGKQGILLLGTLES